MDSLVQEIHDTLALYQTKADTTETMPDGTTRYTLMTRTSGGSVLYMHLPARNFRQPPLDLEQRCGFTGLAGHYQMPEGLSARDLQAYGMVLHHAQMRDDITNRVMQQKMQGVIDRLGELNPQLKDLKPDPHDFDARYDIILGIASAFNPKDIQFYLDGNSGEVAQKNAAWSALSDRIESRVSLTWIPAVDTLQKIDAQMGAPQPVRRLTAGAPSPKNF